MRRWKGGEKGYEKGKKERERIDKVVWEDGEGAERVERGAIVQGGRGLEEGRVGLD